MIDLKKQFKDYEFAFNCAEGLVDQLHHNKIPSVDIMIPIIEQLMIKSDVLIRQLDEIATTLEDDKK